MSSSIAATANTVNEPPTHDLRLPIAGITCAS